MADVYVDRTHDDRIKVTVCRGASPPRVAYFAVQRSAMEFAGRNLGKRSGMILSTLDMTPEQLAAHRARQASS